HSTGAHPVSRCWPAGYVSMVPGNPEQSRQILFVLCLARSMERGVHSGHGGFPTQRYVAPGGLYRMGVGSRERTAIPGADSHGTASGSRAAYLLQVNHGKRACGDQEFHSCLLQPWSAAIERLY